MLVLTSPGTDAYRQADVEVAAALAGQGMVAYENARLFSQVHHLATVDGLTGIANRRHFFDAGRRELALARRRGTSLAAVMLDIDHFKKINDTYGHQVGDDVIRGVVARLRAESRETDVLGRYGGEEFAVLLPDIGDGAVDAAERLRTAVAVAPIETAAGPVAVTISVGVAHLAAADTEPDGLLARADESLYLAKQGGRNRVVVHAGPHPPATLPAEPA
ncbi:GGDEF domain-containing protein [Couchioplanes azureus]|uniref:GGDEF domain-containing protein n=1 Tax=Couchioplanes caeruleus TaxID=56438 RepID=UPI00166FB9E6|nr:GGDEF domain-containing protein [Couchioplanes caeruleus]GGQ82205.1 hypothetical protein GCM10010166_60350 [Couchioplanes caeruleus subsp. azureus]